MTNRINALPTYLSFTTKESRNALFGCPSMTSLFYTKVSPSISYWEFSLQKWIDNSPEGQHSAREDVAQKIKECCAKKCWDLDLSDIQITSLDGVPLPSGLKWLWLNGTQITSLERVNLPSSLEGLYLSEAPITSLDGVSLPSGLKWLRLNGTRITSSSLERINLPSSLQGLYLSRTSISSLDGVSLPSNLQELDLSRTSISSLERINLPSSLKRLWLNGTQITSLERVNLPSSLQGLYLSSCERITSLPESLARLPSSCLLNTQGCRLSTEANQAFQRAIDAAKAQDPSQGPDWHTTVYEEPLSSTIDSLGHFSQLIQQKHPDFNMPAFDESEADRLKAFLEKIQNTADFRSALIKTKLIDTIHLILCAVSTSPKFKQNLFLLINDALDSCSDRTAITLNRIDLQRRLDTSSGINPDLLIGYRRLQLLHEEASKIIRDKHLGDAIEPLLYSQIRLKESLGLPIVTENMLYREMAHITDQELEEIRERILSATSPENRISILTKAPEIIYDDQGRVKQVGDLSPTNPFLADISQLWENQLQAIFHVTFKKIEPAIEEMTDPEKIKEWASRKEALILYLTQQLFLVKRAT